MKLSFRLQRFFLLAILFLLFGFGCKGLTQEEKNAVRPVTLEYWTVFHDVDKLQTLADEFHALRPHITVKIRKVRSDEFENLLVNALADDVGPDIISVNVHELAEYQSRLDSMPKSVTASSVYVKGKYFQETIIETSEHPMPTRREIESTYVGTVEEDAIYDGKIFGLPIAIDTLALYYNKDLLDQAGIAQPPANWQEFLDAVKAGTKFNTAGDLVQSGVALGTGNNIEHAADIFALLLEQNGGKMTDGTIVTFGLGLEQNPQASHPVLETLKFYTDFANADTEAYTWNKSMENALTAFTRNRAVFYFGYAFDLERILSRAPQMNLEILPMPQLNPAKPVNVANYSIESVVKKSSYRNEAWDFIRFISSPGNVERYTQATLRPSPMRAHLGKQKENIRLGPFVETLLTAKNWYRGRDFTLAKDAVEDMIDIYMNPVPADVTKVERDAGVVLNAAQIIQQTM